MSRPTPDVTGTLYGLARHAYAYGLPTVACYQLLHDSALAPWSSRFRAALNEFAPNTGRLRPESRRATLDPGLATGWLDLRAEPVVIDVPRVGEPQLVVTVLDLFARVAGRWPARPTSGGRGSVVVGPSGDATPWPDVPVVRCSTALCLAVVGRAGPAPVGSDPAEVAVPPTVRSWSSWAGLPATESERLPRLVPVPPVDIRWAPSLDFLRVLNWMLRLVPASPGDRFRGQLQSLGVVGADLESLLEDYHAGEELLAGLRMGMQDVLRAVRGGVHAAGAAGVDPDLARAADVYRSAALTTVSQQTTGRVTDASRRPDPPSVHTVIGSGGPSAERRSPQALPSRMATLSTGPSAVRTRRAAAAHQRTAVGRHRGRASQPRQSAEPSHLLTPRWWERGEGASHVLRAAVTEALGICSHEPLEMVDWPRAADLGRASGRDVARPSDDVGIAS